MKWLGWVVLGGVSCVACGGGGGGLGKPVALFPSQADLNSVAASGQAPDPQGATGLADVDSWQMQAPATQPAQSPTSDRDARYPEESVWDKLVVKAALARGNKTHLSPELRCAAEEAARFGTVNPGMPDDGLREHLLLRCGSTLAEHTFSYLTEEVPAQMSEAQLDSSAEAAVQKLVEQSVQAQNGAGELGLGAARGNGRLAVVVMSGSPRAVLHDFSPIVQGDHVTLSGELKTNAEYVVALANQGPYGVARCEGDPLQRLPAFRVTCPLAAGDTATRIEITSKAPGRVLLEPAASLQVRHDDQAELAYNAAAYGGNKQTTGSAQFRAALLADLNQVRAAAGLQPFTLEPRQSVTDDRLAPYLYQTLHSGDDQQATMITLGLLAGWDVSGLIRNGGIFCSSVNTSRNPSRWLTQALDSPLGRWVLLEPTMSRIGIGASQLTPVGEMAVVTTYSFFDKTDHKSDEEAVLAELNRQRRAHGVAPAVRTASDGSIQKALRQINQQAESTLVAMDNVIQETAQARAHETFGYTVETTDVKQLKFDSILTQSSSLNVEVGVTHYRAPGAAWGQYVVLFVVLDHGAPTREAKLAAPSRL